ncbi:hypothetical protein NU10_04925 [Flavobacterium dauae]|uniref:hypothetical protein n=1 Tax=Flavobacterium dauae TaxID=1563479 RepID=UPI00101B3B1B|nr:hypothetical protein [Flavobacterium dauae]WLD24732.1 hypothetical protein NU10_04925 [Flavobacterium dauae]
MQEIAQILEVDVSQILNFDATQVFNISNNHLVQSNIDSKEVQNHTQVDNYTEKYIKMLETEIERLKALVGEK